MGVRRHSEQVRFIAEVLWLIGHSVSQIAALLNMWFDRHGRPPVTTERVKGILRRGSYWNRSAMTPRERQTHLDGLKANRKDKGFFDRDDWKVMDLEPRQMRQAAE